MTDRAQFEEMLNALINEDQEAAKEIFHKIVVGKSREIYEELLAEDFTGGEEEEEEGEAPKAKTPKDSGNPYGDDAGEDDGEDDDMGDDDGEDDDMDGEDDDMDGEDDGEESPFDGEDDGEEGEEGEGDIEDRVMDLEDALEDLKAEFEHLLAGEEHEEHTGVAGDHGGELDGLDGGMGGEHDELEGLMEYTIKVGNPKHGDNGVNTKSTIDNMKNDMGGTTANIAKSFSTEKGGTTGGLAKNTAGDLTAGLNVHNRPGSDAGKSAFKKKEPGHGPEKKGAGEKDVNAKSTISKRVR